MSLLVFVYHFFFHLRVLDRGKNYLHWTQHQDRWGKGTKVENQEACARLSFSTKGAKFWSYVPDKKLCHVKYSKSGRKPHTDVVSGNRECGKAGNQFSTLNCAVLLFFCFHSLLLFIRNSIFAYLSPHKSCKLANWTVTRTLFGKARKPFYVFLKCIK